MTPTDRELLELAAERDALTLALETLRSKLSDYEAAMAENEALRADAERLAAIWSDAYLAFQGAFDTPQQRRLMPDEYSQDARSRLREFNYAIDAAKEQKP